MIAGKAAGMGKSKRKDEQGGSIRKPTAVSEKVSEVPVDKALPRITSQVEYPSLQAANKSTTGASQGSGQTTEADISLYSSAATQTVAAVAEKIQTKVEAMRPQREQLKRCVEACLTGALAGNTIEVVGSTAWGGEVPQSDLDLVLVTAAKNSDAAQALLLLQALEKKLESQTEAERVWSRLELVEARKVPLLRLYDRAGLSCDVVVDQLHALEHRKLLVEALEGRPEVKTFIRLVKYWLRQRGLPMGSEGGLPSFAWAYSALQLAMQLPRESTVERLLFHFFKQMSLLSSMTLLVQTTKDGSARAAWKSREHQFPWAQEWMEFIWVDDPRREVPEAAKRPGMTPNSIPVALAALYVAELRLAFRAIQEVKWDDLWRPFAKTPLTSTSSTSLQIFVKHGELLLGKLEKVVRLPGARNQELHRRDQSSELQFRKCTSKDPRSDSTKCIMTEKTLCCKPCNWVCALPIWNRTVKAGDAQTRLNELAALAETWRPMGPMGRKAAPQRAKAPARGYLVPVLTPSVMMLSGYPVGVYVMQMENVLVNHPSTKEAPKPQPLLGFQQAQPQSASEPEVKESIEDQRHPHEHVPVSEESSPAEKASSDDSTRASDSEEFTPVRPKQKAVPAVPALEAMNTNESRTLGLSEVDHPLALSLALSLDVPRRLSDSLPARADLSARILKKLY